MNSKSCKAEVSQENKLVKKLKKMPARKNGNRHQHPHNHDEVGIEVGKGSQYGGGWWGAGLVVDSSLPRMDLTNYPCPITFLSYEIALETTPRQLVKLQKYR